MVILVTLHLSTLYLAVKGHIQMSLRSVYTGIPTVSKLGCLLCFFHCVTSRDRVPVPYTSVAFTQH